MLAFAFAVLLSAIVHGQDLVEGLPTLIIGKLRDNKDSVFIDLQPELQASYDWAKTQPGFEDLGFPLEQSVPGLPVVGDLAIRVEDLVIRRFDAFKEDDTIPVVERTDYGYHMGLFNIGIDLVGMTLRTGGFFGGLHKGCLSIDFEDCWVEVEKVEGELLPRITAKVENPSFTFSSPSMLTEIMMKPALMLAESYIVEAIEEAFSAALRFFWLPVNCDAYIAAAADALYVEDAAEPAEDLDASDGLFTDIEGDANWGDKIEA